MGDKEQGEFAGCKEYRLDVQAAKFGYCVCGEAKQRHSTAALENQKSKKLSRDKFTVEDRRSDGACDKFTLDMAKGFGQCTCGKPKSDHRKEALLAASKGASHVKSSRFHKLDTTTSTGGTAIKSQSTRLFAPPPKPQRNLSAREAFLRGDFRHSSSEPSFWTSGSSTTLLQGEAKASSSPQSKSQSKRPKIEVDLTYFTFLGGKTTETKPIESPSTPTEGSHFRNPFLMNELAAKLGVKPSPQHERPHAFADEEANEEPEATLSSRNEDLREARDNEGVVEERFEKEQDHNEELPKVLVEPELNGVDADETTKERRTEEAMGDSSEGDHSDDSAASDGPKQSISAELLEEADQVNDATGTRECEIDTADLSEESEITNSVQSQSSDESGMPETEEEADPLAGAPSSVEEKEENKELDHEQQVELSNENQDHSDDSGEEHSTTSDGGNQDQQKESASDDGAIHGSNQMQMSTDGQEHKRPPTNEGDVERVHQTEENETNPEWVAKLEPTRISANDENIDSKKSRKVCCTIT